MAQIGLERTPSTWRGEMFFVYFQIIRIYCVVLCMDISKLSTPFATVKIETLLVVLWYKRFHEMLLMFYAVFAAQAQSHHPCDSDAKWQVFIFCCGVRVCIIFFETNPYACLHLTGCWLQVRSIFLSPHAVACIFSLIEESISTIAWPNIISHIWLLHWGDSLLPAH